MAAQDRIGIRSVVTAGIDGVADPAVTRKLDRPGHELSARKLQSGIAVDVEVRSREVHGPAERRSRRSIDVI
jgi:hypothetical protein